jgi:hypothetical protein
VSRAGHADRRPSTPDDRQDTDAASPAPVIGGRTGSRGQMLGRMALTVALIGLIGWIVLGNVTELSSVLDALRAVTAWQIVLLLVLPAAWQLLVAAELATTVAGLGMARSVVAVEGASAVSNVVPGPSGTGTRLMMLRSWGFRVEEFAKAGRSPAASRTPWCWRCRRS